MILSIDSPGGTTTGAEKLYEAIRRLAAKKPVVAVVNNMAASGAYIAALSADQIVAHGNSLVGSIGVLIQYPNIASLLDKIGVKIDAVKSSPLKAEPSGYEPTSPEVRQALASLVDDSYAWFKDLVQKRRQLSDAELAAVDNGRVFTGRQALGLEAHRRDRRRAGGRRLARAEEGRACRASDPRLEGRQQLGAARHPWLFGADCRSFRLLRPCPRI